MIKLRDYQIENSNKAFEILKSKKIVYLAMEVRTGKTLTALNIAGLYGAKKVLFLTKKLAIDSIQNDYNALGCSFEITIANNESLHKVPYNDFDLIISDEHHRISSFPKPSKMAKDIKLRFASLPMIFLSGTPAVESGSQWYHQFWISKYSPFANYQNFYKWAKDYVNISQRNYGYGLINDYSKANTEKILSVLEPYVLKYTQKEAGFLTEIKETILYSEPVCKNLTEALFNDNIIVGKEETIIADTAVKLMGKIHQIENGTIIFESGNSKVLNTSKAEFIKSEFEGKKIAIFYYYQKELELLMSVFGQNLTTSLDEFNSSDKNFAVQQVRGSEGISLKNAEALVYYNFGFSGVKMIQGRDRMTTKDREHNNVYFVFAKGSINEKIYKVLQKKKRYSEKIFIKDYGTAIANSNKKAFKV